MKRSFTFYIINVLSVYYIESHVADMNEYIILKVIKIKCYYVA